MTGINQSFTLPQRSVLGGSQHVDLAFKPRVMFMTGCAVGTASLGTTFYNNAWGGFGWSLDPSLGNECSSVGSGGYQSGHVPGQGYISDSVFAGIYENTNLREKSIDLVSLDCDTSTGHATSGYTYTTGSALQTGVVATLALGGDDISSATGSFNWPGSAGDEVVTGVGFEPQLVMFLWSKMDTYNRGYSFGDNNGSSFGLGASDGTDSFAIYTGSDGGTGSGDAIHQTGACIICHDYTSVIATGVLASMDSDGFTVTFDGDDTGEPLAVTPRLIGWIALRNDGSGGFKVGNETVPSSTGTVAYTGCGFQPDQVITAHGNSTSANTVVYGGSWGIGMFDETLQMAFLNGENLVPFPQYGARLCNTTALEFGTNVVTTTDGRAERDSIDSDGFTLDWTNVDVPGKPWSWIAMKTTGTNFGGTCGGVGSAFLGQIYRRL